MSTLRTSFFCGTLQHPCSHCLCNPVLSGSKRVRNIQGQVRAWTSDVAWHLPAMRRPPRKSWNECCSPASKLEDLAVRRNGDERQFVSLSNSQATLPAALIPSLFDVVGQASSTRGATDASIALRASGMAVEQDHHCQQETAQRHDHEHLV